MIMYLDTFMYSHILTRQVNQKTNTLLNCSHKYLSGLKSSPYKTLGPYVVRWHSIPGLKHTHTDLSSSFVQVQITLSTHDCGGLSQRDITLATFIDQASLMWAASSASDSEALKVTTSQSFILLKNHLWFPMIWTKCSSCVVLCGCINETTGQMFSKW